MYNVIVWRVNGDEDFFAFEKKPEWKQIYPLINCDMIEIQKGFNQDVSNRSFEMLCDEESKLKEPFYINKRATNAWYEWQKRTNHMCIPGDFIAGDIAIIRDVGNIKEKLNESN
jgi:hypothetical protein